MCGRFTQTREPEAVAGHFQAVLRFPGSGPRYNIAPGQVIAVVITGAGGRELVPMRWGLLPPWPGGHPQINARAESVARKAAFSVPFARRRCLVPADGWYEWQKAGKTPYRIVCGEGGLFALAGIWNPGPGDDDHRTFAVLTIPAAGEIQHIHDRMPLVFTGEAEYARWLEGGPPLSLLRNYPAECRAYRVSRAVNSPRADRPELIEPFA